MQARRWPLRAPATRTARPNPGRITGSTRNLSSIFESVHATLVNYEYQAWIEKGTVPAWLQKSQAGALNALHEPILDAVRSGDAALGARAVLRHHEVMAQHLADSH